MLLVQCAWQEEGGGGRYLIPETSLPKLPLRAAATAALLSFYCCSVARGAHPGNHQAAQRQKRGKFLSSLPDPSVNVHLAEDPFAFALLSTANTTDAIM